MADGQTSTMVWPDIRRGLLMDTYISIGQPATGLGMDVSIKPGETVDASGLHLTYKLATRTGEMGVPGTRFGAEVSVNNGSETIKVHPEMELGNGEVIPHPARLDNQMELRMNGMNAKDKSVNLRLQLTTPVYPVQIYHKPLTILVWIGTGVMTLAGLLSAFYPDAGRDSGDSFNFDAAGHSFV
jgi:cytochrome c-type biogenesis protein CcmF